MRSSGESSVLAGEASGALVYGVTSLAVVADVANVAL